MFFNKELPHPAVFGINLMLVRFFLDCLIMLSAMTNDGNMDWRIVFAYPTLVFAE